MLVPITCKSFKTRAYRFKCNALIHQILTSLRDIHGTRIMTLHANAPASRIAQAKQLLLRLLITAFQPLCAHIALTIISMSEPNCLF